MFSANSFNLDVNATYGVEPEVLEYLKSVLPSCLNASSVHSAGQRARALMEAAREEILGLVGAAGKRLVFTSGATESNNLLINSFICGKRFQERKNHIVISSVEHPSILEPAQRFAQMGGNLSMVVPSENGKFNSDDFINACHSETNLVSCMLANNETGDLLPVKEISSALQHNNIHTFMHCDAVQALGKMELNMSKLGVDCLSLSGHKIGALPGVGALIFKHELELSPLILGGPQEMHFRAGTENLPGIVSFGYMAAKLKKTLQADIGKMKKHRKIIFEILKIGIADLRLNSFSDESLPNTLNLRIAGVRSDDLVVALDLKGICISSGAACASGKPQPSHVLLAMGLSEEQARQSIRISVGPHYLPEEISSCANSVVECVAQMRGNSGKSHPKENENYVR